MNYTPNYHLPTWAMTDRIQMSDFNDMTAKLDAALKAEANARTAADTAEAKARTAGDLLVKLKEQTLSADAPQMDISLSGIDLSQYRQLDLWLEPVLKTDGPKAFFIRLNGLTEGYYSGNDTSTYMGEIATGTEQGKFCSGCYHFYLADSIAGSVDSAYIASHGMSGQFSKSTYGIELAPSALHTINILGWKPSFTDVLKGTKIRLYGWKK